MKICVQFAALNMRTRRIKNGKRIFNVKMIGIFLRTIIVIGQEKENLLKKTDLLHNGIFPAPIT